MNEQILLFQELVLSRRSIRIYEQRPIPQDVLETLMTAAIWAPSAHNRQPWRFAIIIDAEQKAALARAMGVQLQVDLEQDGVPAQVINKDVRRSYERLTGAPALICLCMSFVDMDQYPDTKRNEAERTMAIQSVAMAGQNLLLAAHAAGLGACWMCAPLFCPDVVGETLDLPDDWEPQALIALGYPAQERQRDRKLPVVVWR